MNSPPNLWFKRSAVCLWYHYSTQLWICLDRKRGVIKSFILPSRTRVYNKVENPPFSHFYYGCRRLFAFSTKKSSVLSYIFGAERQKCIKRVKTAKNILDKCKISCYNIASRPWRWVFITAPKKISKKLKKLSKKVLTKGIWCGIISKSPRKAETHGHWKLNNKREVQS